VPDSYYSHGFLIPFVTVFLIWQKKDKLRTLAPESSSLGIILIAIGLLMQIVSVITEVYLVSEISLLLNIFGVVLFLFGKKTCRELFFPLAFLTFMIPIPMFLINQISFPMRLIVTNSVVFTLTKFGLPINQKGFEIIFPNTTLVVDTPCSGLRSLIAFLALGSLFAYFFRGALKKKILLLLMAIPIAFITNFLRIAFLSLTAFVYGAHVATKSVYHDLSGIFVFVIGIILFNIIRGILNERI
jgi:exosortase